MARQHPPQVMGFGRADPVPGVAAGREEHRDRQPRRAGRLHHHLKQGAWSGLGQRGPLHLFKTVHGRDRLAAAHQAAVAGQHPHGVGAGDPKVDPDQPSVVGPVASLPWWPAGRPLRWGGAGHGHGPKGAASDDGTHSCAATGPDPAGSGHFLIRGIRGRPRAAIRPTRLGAPAPTSEEDSTPPPEPAGMHMQPRDLGADQAPRSLT
jgi:hypothetical protein